ncbi:hypothetical protein EYF80_007816 [Liparis tanakae]|uniref:Uncharacterized protein n=1 Tax=Liparis tanakae TaxID=230148 RepID=A0A4Z2IWK4_9TELE|nr:hypothetical protein EYF80_007816 [Liparis tanakae]
MMGVESAAERGRTGPGRASHTRGDVSPKRSPADQGCIVAVCADTVPLTHQCLIICLAPIQCDANQEERKPGWSGCSPGFAVGRKEEQRVKHHHYYPECAEVRCPPGRLSASLQRFTSTPSSFALCLAPSVRSQSGSAQLRLQLLTAHQRACVRGWDNRTPAYGLKF